MLDCSLAGLRASDSPGWVEPRWREPNGATGHRQRAGAGTGGRDRGVRRAGGLVAGRVARGARDGARRHRGARAVVAQAVAGVAPRSRDRLIIILSTMTACARVSLSRSRLLP